MKKGIAPRESKVSVFKISFGPSYRTRVISALFSVGKRRETSDGLKEKDNRHISVLVTIQKKTTSV